MPWNVIVLWSYKETFMRAGVYTGYRPLTHCLLVSSKYIKLQNITWLTFMDKINKPRPVLHITIVQLQDAFAELLNVCCLENLLLHLIFLIFHVLHAVPFAFHLSLHLQHGSSAFASKYSLSFLFVKPYTQRRGICGNSSFWNTTTLPNSMGWDLERIAKNRKTYFKI